MTRTTTTSQEQETSFDEPGPSSQNQVALPTANSAVALSSSSSRIYDWSTSDEEDGKELALSRRQRINEPYAITTFTNCNDVTNISNINHIHKEEVIVKKNYFYCCPFSVDHVLKYCLTRCCIASFISVLVTILIIVIFSMWLSSLRIRKQDVIEIVKKDTQIDAGTVVSSSIATDAELPMSLDVSPPIVIFPNSYNGSHSGISNHTDWKIVSRKDWQAASFKQSPKKLAVLPPLYIIISETETDLCITQQKCMENVLNMQAAQMKKGLDDIAYNFLVVGDGMVYEGRGWDVAGDHTDFDSVDYDDNSIDVSFIGSFDIDVPTESQLQAAITLMEYGVQNKKINVDYKLKALKQLSLLGENPGDNLYNKIITWKKWDTKTIDSFMVIEDYF